MTSTLFILQLNYYQVKTWLAKKPAVKIYIIKKHNGFYDL